MNRIRNDMKLKLVITMSLLVALASCTVRQATEQVDRQVSTRRVASVAKREATGFTQEGIAGLRAGEGGTGDNLPRALTASHKTLPLDLLVRVRNKESGQSVIVRIAERGPLVKGRILDLSPLAARRLGIGASSAAAVRIEALGFKGGYGKAERTYRVPESYDEGNFSVQVMVFADATQARQLAEKMRRLFGYAEVRATTEGGQHFYRVFVGKYGSLKEADSAERNFSEHGYPASFVLSLD